MSEQSSVAVEMTAASPRWAPLNARAAAVHTSSAPSLSRCELQIYINTFIAPMRVENIFTRVRRIPSNTTAYIILTAFSQ